ncbi:MAG: AMP-binding protein [Thermoplasmatota archaeon]
MRLIWDGREVPADGAALAAALSGLGARPGHRVGVITGNTPLHVRLHAAAALLELVLVPLPPNVPRDGLERRLAETPVDALVVEPGERVAPELPRLEASPAGDALAVRGYVATPPGPGGRAVVVRTSGTSGTPRPVTLTAAMLAAHADACRDRLGDGPRAVWLGLLPLRHVGGIALVDRALRNDSALVLQPRFRADAAWNAITKHEVTHVSVVPTMLHRLLHEERRPPTSLRCVLLGGDAAPRELMERGLAEGWPLFATYGLTEACSQVATATPEESRAHPGTVGRPLPGIRVDIDQGEIVLSGPTIVGGGPLHTGDLGRLEEGRLFVTGRRADVIITGGEKVLPQVVEGVLGTHPAVRSACVVGLPDAEWGQRVAAAVVLQGGASDEELAAFCRKRLPPAAVPKAWKRLATIPSTEAGKLRRQAVRDGWAQPAT